MIKVAGPPIHAPLDDAGSGVVAPLALGDLVPHGFLDIPEGGELVVKSTVSGRELSLRGPATAELCPSGDEEVRLSVGTFRGFPGAGVRPGAEVWVATPFGVIRFNDANLEILVSPPRAASLSINVVSGRAVLAPVTARSSADAVGREVDVTAGKPLSVEAPPRSARESAAACATFAELVPEKARAVLSSDAGTLGSRAGLYVEARKQARTVCSSAAAAAGLAGEGTSGLLGEIESSERRWKSFPMTLRAPDASAGDPRSN